MKEREEPIVARQVQGQTVQVHDRGLHRHGLHAAVLVVVAAGLVTGCTGPTTATPPPSSVW